MDTPKSDWLHVFRTIALWLVVNLVGAEFTNEVCHAQSSLQPNSTFQAASIQIRRTAVEPDESPTDTVATSRLQSQIARACASDADLNDLATLTADRLVAVGNCGAIWVSESGGRSWSKQESHTTANLYSVKFLDAKSGICVGGIIGNYTGTSYGTILKTEDGGQTWQSIPNDLPTLRGIDEDGGQLVAWGDFCPRLKTSVFRSSDRGATWQTTGLPLGHAAAAAFGRPGELLAVDQLQRAAAVDTIQNRVSPIAIGSVEQKPAINCLHYTGTRWLASCANGKILTSVDGQNWLDAKIPLSSEAMSICQWRSISQTADHISICGSPGSLFLHSSDGGISWSTQRTGQSLPITRIRFLDERRGWAVGSLGQILATRDGGASWYGQRNANRQAGVLTISSRPDKLPWAPMLATSWEHGITSVAAVFKTDAPTELSDFLPTRTARTLEIGPRVGISLEHRELAGGTSDEGDAEAQEALQHVAALLMTWRPSIVLADERPSTEAWPDEHHGPLSPSQIANTAFAAVQIAQQKTERSTAFAELGLDAWQVEKIVVATDTASSQYSEQSQRVLKSIGLALWDIGTSLPPVDLRRAESTSLRTHWSATSNHAAKSSLTGGVAFSNAAQRKQQLAGLGNYQLVMGRTHRLTSLEQLMVPENDIQANDARWLSDVNFLVSQLPEHEIAPVMQSMTHRLARPSQAKQRAVALQFLIKRSPVGDGVLWGMHKSLTQLGSEEFAAWQNSEQRQLPRSLAKASQSTSNSGEQPLPPLSNQPDGTTSSQADLASKPWDASPFASEKLGSETTAREAVVPENGIGYVDASRFPPTRRPLDGSGVVFATASEPAQAQPNAPGPRSAAAIPDRLDEPSTDRSQLWFAELDRYSQIEPRLLSRPDVRLLSVRTSARLAQDASRDRVEFQELLSMPQLTDWAQVAQQELRLEMNQIAGEKWLAVAAPAPHRPKLDGQLTEPFWRTAPPMHLRGSNADKVATLVRWSYDDHYLYIALQCNRDTQTEPIPVQRVRDYDSNLGSLDHVQLVLDTDRDYATAIELAVAADGRTYDRCDGQPEFDPKWHVCVESGTEHWTAEIAVELRYLTPHPDLVGGAWAVSARRSQPNAAREGFDLQSWGRKRDHSPMLNGSGLLLFAPAIK